MRIIYKKLYSFNYSAGNLVIIYLGGFETLLGFVKNGIETQNKKRQLETQKENSKDLKTMELDDNKTSAYQEVYELSQRRFLKELTKYCEKTQPELDYDYPRLLCVDQMNASKLEPILKEKKLDSLTSVFKASRRRPSIALGDETITETLSQRPTSAAKTRTRNKLIISVIYWLYPIFSFVNNNNLLFFV